MGVMLLLLIIILVIVAAVNAGKKEPEKAPEKAPEKTVPTIRVSDDLKVKAPPAADSITIYINTERTGDWVCPNCECENPNSSTFCCVCNNRREAR